MAQDLLRDSVYLSAQNNGFYSAKSSYLASGASTVYLMTLRYSVERNKNHNPEVFLI